MISVRAASIDDVAAITAIYNEAVLGSLATFDEQESSVDDRTRWFEQFSHSGRHRLLVAVDDADDSVVGYAGSMSYRSHPAFVDTVEFTVYITAVGSGRGVGSRLYDALFEELRGERVHCVVVGIALPNDASIALHRRFGFTDVGVFREYATKHGTRIDSLWMQRILDRSDLVDDPNQTRFWSAEHTASRGNAR